MSIVAATMGRREWNGVRQMGQRESGGRGQIARGLRLRRKVVYVGKGGTGGIVSVGWCGWFGDGVLRKGGWNGNDIVGFSNIVAKEEGF
jgi:hypothetical protein